MMNMKYDLATNLIVRWADKRGYARVVRADERGRLETRIEMKCAQVCFVESRLVDIATFPSACADALAEELAGVFALCGYLELAAASAEMHRHLYRFVDSATDAPTMPPESVRPPHEREAPAQTESDGHENDAATKLPRGRDRVGQLFGIER